MIFGLTSNDPLPDVDDDTLETYHRHLANNLVFPFQAECGAEYGHSERVKVIGLGDPDEEPMIDEEYGIPCEARLDGQVVTVPLGELDNVKGNGGCEMKRGRLSLGGTKVATSVSIFTTRSSVAKWRGRPRRRWTREPSMV